MREGFIEAFLECNKDGIEPKPLGDIGDLIFFEPDEYVVLVVDMARRCYRDCEMTPNDVVHFRDALSDLFNIYLDGKYTNSFLRSEKGLNIQNMFMSVIQQETKIMFSIQRANRQKLSTK